MGATVTVLSGGPVAVRWLWLDSPLVANLWRGAPERPSTVQSTCFTSTLTRRRALTARRLGRWWGMGGFTAQEKEESVRPDGPGTRPEATNKAESATNLQIMLN